MRVRRAALYMPGDSMRKICKAAALSVDCIIMDIEDGVAFNQKAAARATILEALKTVDFGRNERLVRVNGVGSGLTARDIIETIAGEPDAYVLPKVESAKEIIYVDYLLRDLEAQHGFPVGRITLQAILESAQGIMAAREIAQASPRLTALQFGSEDLAGDLGATRSAAGSEIFYARSLVVTVATAYGLQAIDGVFLNFADTEGAYQEAKRAAQMGYQGKLAIHPRQIEPYHRAFTPSDAEIAAAQRLVDAFEAHQAKGIGAFVLDGKMIDEAIV
ncbi:MAG: HpcH/HpaI aldolase/citrate lyase family protein, partial [Ardenticatenaceae bacterium]